MKRPTVLAAGARQRKAQAARSEQEGVGTPDAEAPFASQEGVKRPTVLAAGARQRKAQAARSECEGDGASDVEALFCSLQSKQKGQHKGCPFFRLKLVLVCHFCIFLCRQ